MLSWQRLRWISVQLHWATRQLVRWLLVILLHSSTVCCQQPFNRTHAPGYRGRYSFFIVFVRSRDSCFTVTTLQFIVLATLPSCHAAEWMMLCAINRYALSVNEWIKGTKGINRITYQLAGCLKGKTYRSRQPPAKNTSWQTDRTVWVTCMREYLRCWTIDRWRQCRQHWLSVEQP